METAMAEIEESFESLGGMLDSDAVCTGFISGHSLKLQYRFKPVI